MRKSKMAIEKSKDLNELFGALSKLQGKIEKAKKDQAGYKNNYKFAELSQYIDLSQDLLAEFGLCVLQIPGPMEIIQITREINTTEIVETTKEVYNPVTKTSDFHLVKSSQPKIEFHTVKIPKQRVTTMIAHESGQFINGSMDIILEKLAGMSWGQSTGSAITYARKYSRAGSLGMSQEDDDNQNNRQKSQPQNKPVAANNKPLLINSQMAKNLAGILSQDPERLNKILEHYRIKRIEDLSIEQYEVVMNRVKEVAHVETISEHQANFMKRLLTPEKLLDVMKEYKITRLEEMNVQDYNKLNDKLRLQSTQNNPIDDNEEQVA